LLPIGQSAFDDDEIDPEEPEIDPEESGEVGLSTGGQPSRTLLAIHPNVDIHND